MAIAGSLAVEGPVITWVSDHRRHHKYSDKEGDPHSPWRFGTGWKALSKGLLWAHTGWLFDPNKTSQEKFSPDLLADRAIRKTDDFFIGWVAISLLGPALIGGLWGMSFHGALTAFFWASLVRVCLLHHVTWSINSVCHVFGNEDFTVRDKSRNVAWLAIRRSASRGTTCTTPTRPAPGTARCAASLTPAPASSGRSRSSAGRGTCAGRMRSGSRPSARPASKRILGSMTKRPP